MNFWICHCSRVHIAYCSACRGEMCNGEMLSVMQACFWHLFWHDWIVSVSKNITPPLFIITCLILNRCWQCLEDMLAKDFEGRHFGHLLLLRELFYQWFDLIFNSRHFCWNLTFSIEYIGWLMLQAVVSVHTPVMDGKLYAHYCLRFKPCTWQLCTLSSVCIYVCNCSSV